MKKQARNHRRNTRRRAPAPGFTSGELATLYAIPVLLLMGVFFGEFDARMEDKANARYGDATKPVVLWHAKPKPLACRQDDWLCEIDGRVIKQGQVYTKSGGIVLAERN